MNEHKQGYESENSHVLVYSINLLTPDFIGG